MTIRPLLLLAVLGWSGTAKAEGGCPPGQYPYNTPQARQCVPIPGGGGGSAPMGFVEIYADRWGAVAVDNNVKEGGIGTVENMPSKRKAKTAAINQCKATGGGKTCKVYMAYRNQCAALVWSTHTFNVWTGSSIEDASNAGVEDCKKKSSHCRVHYSGCSYPELIN